MLNINIVYKSKHLCEYSCINNIIYYSETNHKIIVSKYNYVNSY